MCNGESLHEQVRMVTPVCIEGLCSTQQLAIVLEEVVVACVGEVLEKMYGRLHKKEKSKAETASSSNRTPAQNE